MTTSVDGLSPNVTRTSVRFGRFEVPRVPHDGFGLILTSPTQAPSSYLDPVFAEAMSREAFFSTVDRHGLVVARQLEMDLEPYRPVRGKRGHGRMSQGEFYHHDGCSTPVRPRVVEIRCPPQDVVRRMGTTGARFPEIVQVMLGHLPEPLRRTGGLAELHDELVRGRTPDVDWESVQGVLNRILRNLDTETTRTFLNEVDRSEHVFAEPWEMFESRFFANENAERTVQHRRACRTPWVPGIPNGSLVKRWPAEELPAVAVHQQGAQSP